MEKMYHCEGNKNKKNCKGYSCPHSNPHQKQDGCDVICGLARVECKEIKTKEKKMTGDKKIKEYKVREDKIQELAKKGPQYKEAMEILFPKAFVSKKTRLNITRDITWKLASDDYLYGYYAGERILCASPKRGFRIRSEYDKDISIKIEVEGNSDVGRIFLITEKTC